MSVIWLLLREIGMKLKKIIIIIVVIFHKKLLLYLNTCYDNLRLLLFMFSLCLFYRQNNILNSTLRSILSPISFDTLVTYFIRLPSNRSALKHIFPSTNMNVSIRPPFHLSGRVFGTSLDKKNRKLSASIPPWDSKDTRFIWNIKFLWSIEWEYKD